MKDHSNNDAIIQAMEDNYDAMTLLLPLNNPNYAKSEFNNMGSSSFSNRSS